MLEVKDFLFERLIMQGKDTRTFYDRDNQDVVYLDENPQDYGVSTEQNEALRAALARDWNDRFVPLPVIDDYELMLDFADGYDVPWIRRRLMNALNSRYPMTAFNQRARELGIGDEWEAFRCGFYNDTIEDWRRENAI